MTNVHVHVPEAPFWDRDIYGSAMYNGVPVFSKLGRGPRGFKGEKGDKGESAASGEDGFSPYVEFTTEAGRDVMVVVDRNGEHKYPFAVAQDPAAMANAFTTSNLWPKWYHYYLASEDLKPSTYTQSNNVTVHRHYIENEAGTGHYARVEGGNIIPVSDDVHNTWPSVLGDYEIVDAKFFRNGLEYTYVPNSVLPQTTVPMFNIGVSNDRLRLQFLPMLTNQHSLETCSLSLLIAPKASSRSGLLGSSAGSNHGVFEDEGE